MRQQAWMRWASILLAAAIAAGSPAGFAAAKSKEMLPMEGVTEPRAASALAMEELPPSAAPLGVDGELPGEAAEIADAGLSEPQPRPLKSETRTDVRYSMAELNSLSYEELTDLLVRIEWHKIPELFKYNDDTRRFYEDENRFQAIVDRLQESGTRFTPEDDQGIPTLVEVLRSGYYLGYYNKELARINEPAFRDKMLPAIKAIIDNPAFAWGNDLQNKVIGATGRMISNSTTDPDTVKRLTGLLQSFNDRADALSGDYEASSAFYEVMKGVGYVLMWRMNEPDREAAFKGSIDGYLEQLFRMAQHGPASADKVWLTNNAIYYTGSLGRYYSEPQQVNRVLTDVMQTAPALGEIYFVAADQIDQHYAGTDASGRRVDMDELKRRGKEQYLPQRIEFDDGRFVFRTGSQLSEEQLQRLYWAAKEVQAQFHRVIGSDQPLETGNPDDVLTVVIYNNPDEYRMNRYLYGYDTDNGGIYIEPDGTFFTYDRTIDQSIYSLEELFRHEFTHYLQGRYEVPGMWGQGPLYKTGRMQWFDEGGAEFFAGATRTEGIQPRKSVVGNLRHDGPGERFTVSDTVNSQYGTWKFYDYSFALYDYLYHQDFMTLDRIHSAIRFNDAAAYDGQLAAISGNSHMNASYQHSIEEQVARYDNLTVPLVSDDYLLTPEPKPVRDIYSEITAVAGLQDTSTHERESRFFRSFELRGTYIGGTTEGKDQDWHTMNSLTDGFLQALSEQPWNGYKTVTAYFTNYRVNDEGRFVYDVVFHGKLPADGDAGKNPDDNGVQLPDGGTGNEGNEGAEDGGHDGGQPNADHEPNDSWEQAVPLDGTGVPVSGKLSDTDRVDVYRFDAGKAEQWTIELETEQAQSVAWVVHHESDLNNYAAYPTQVEGTSVAGSVDAVPGTYYVYVYSVGNGEQSYRLVVQPGTGQEQEPELPPFEETEPNDTPETANGPIPAGRPVVGTLNGSDKQDVFIIDVDQPAELQIELERRLGSGVNWILYREGDTDRPLLYPSEVEGNRMSGGFAAEAGRYHLYVYKYTDEDIHYTLQVQH
ncbi:microbial collagenase precursor [Paenibacillus dendritiformis C454]|uniref:microbial collagenase n=1 Tax=Paenibacillus dendritiformis C454 TaxID=1131935 RepID=H3SCL2_9BACL|nr:collagenase [Paenibacillus dendritiformis]EHQ63115.1 microbial collagenase precursor [Paenibacillus dendritiformis C454]